MREKRISCFLASLFAVLFALALFRLDVVNAHAEDTLPVTVEVSDKTCTITAAQGYERYTFDVTNSDAAEKTTNVHQFKMVEDTIYRITVTAYWRENVASEDSNSVDDGGLNVDGNTENDKTETVEKQIVSKTFTVCVPGAVSNLVTCGRNRTKVELSWDAKATAEEYIIYRDGNKIATTDSSSYMVNVSYGRKYTFSVEAVYGNVRGEASVIGYNNSSFVSTSHQKYSYAEMVSDLNALEKKYHGMIQKKVITTTADKRNVYDVILGNPKAKKCILVTASMHAREYMTTLVTMKQIEYYLEYQTSTMGKTTVANTLDKVCIHFVPMVNPDGVTISQSGSSAIRDASLRKKVKKMGASKRWKANARGVDLNRNWAYKWYKSGKAGASGYTGSSAFSEKETKALSNLKKSLKNNYGLKGIISYHTMGNILFGSTAGTTSSVKSGTKKMYNLAKSLTHYSNADGIYQSSGATNSREWDLYRLKVPSITLECGAKSAPGPISEFSSIWKRNKYVSIREAQLFY